MTTFTNVFGGTVIYPADVSYRAFTLSANTTLAWPTELATNADIVSQIMDVAASGNGFSILMPPANEVSVGETTLIFNVGAYTITIKDNLGGTIASISPGLAWQIYLTDNTTPTGSWRPVQYAAGVSSATAGALQGAGIKAIADTLNQSTPVMELAANYTMGNTDRAKVFLWTGGAGTLTLPAASTVGNDWFCYVRNSGTGAVTIATPGGELVNGGSSLAFNPGDSSSIICDGTNYYTIGFGQNPVFTFDYVAINLTGQVSPYALSGANLNRITYNFSGVLTANMIVVVPDTIQQYWVANNTTGSYTLTIANASGSGIAVAQGSRTILYCDGVDIYSAETGGVSLPVSVSQGGTGSTTAGNALINLGGGATGISVFESSTQNAAQVALGGTSVGIAVFTAVDQAAAQAAIGTGSGNNDAIVFAVALG